MEIEKITPVKDMLVFCSGRTEYTKLIRNYMTSNPQASDDEILHWLNSNIILEDIGRTEGVSLVVCSVTNGKSLVRSFELLDCNKKFKHTVWTAEGNGVNILAAGYLVNEVKDAATQIIADNEKHGRQSLMVDIYPKVFEAIACNQVGGGVYLYQASHVARLINNKKLREDGIEYYDILSTGQIKGYAITAQQIAAGQILAGHIAAGAIDAGHINANSVAAAVVETGILVTDRITAPGWANTYWSVDGGAAHFVLNGTRQLTAEGSGNGGNITAWTGRLNLHSTPFDEGVIINGMDVVAAIRELQERVADLEG
jgi:hypothetical protein